MNGPKGRRALLSCVLRLMQASWNIGNFNAVMEILLGLRSVQLYYICLWTVNDVTGKTPWKDPPWPGSSAFSVCVILP